MKKIWLSLLFGILSFIIACAWGTQTIKRRASFDLDCPENQITVKTISAGQSYAAFGCGRKAIYVIDKYGEPLLNSKVTKTSPTKPAQNQK